MPEPPVRFRANPVAIRVSSPAVRMENLSVLPPAALRPKNSVVMVLTTTAMVRSMTMTPPAIAKKAPLAPVFLETLPPKAKEPAKKEPRPVYPPAPGEPAKAKSLLPPRSATTKTTIVMVL